MSAAVRERLEQIKVGILEAVNCRKVQANGCDCREGGLMAIKQLDDLLALVTSQAADPVPAGTARRQIDQVGKHLMSYVMACQADGVKPSVDVVRAVALLSMIEVPSSAAEGGR